MALVSPGDKYVHYSNNRQYVVLGLSTNATNGLEDEEKSVCYMDILTGTIYHRKYSEFFSEVKKDGQILNRFYQHGYANVHICGKKGEVKIEQLFLRG